MGKPKSYGETKDGQHLLVQVSATDSDVQEFTLPPRRIPRVRQKKSSSHHSAPCGHDFTWFVLVMAMLIMMAAIGFLGFEYYKLNGEVEKLKKTQDSLENDWSSDGSMSKKVDGAAVKADVDKLMKDQVKKVNELYSGLSRLNYTFHAWHKKVNLSISDLNSDAKHWQFVFENTGKLAKVNKNVGGLETEVAKLASNVQEMDSEQRAMNNAVAQLKIDSAENKKVVTTLNSDFPQLKVSLQTAVSSLGDLEHSHSEMELRTTGLTSVNVTQMDAEMQAMQSSMTQMSTVVELLKATASSGENGANLTLVITKLEQMKQAGIKRGIAIQSLKRRLAGVERLEADHKDEHDTLETIITRFNSSLSDIKDGRQRTDLLMEQHVRNVTAQIEAQLEGFAALLGDIMNKTSDSLQSFNVSSFINEVLNQLLASVQGQVAQARLLFDQGVDLVQQTLQLQNMTIAELQQELQQVRTSLWQLKAEMTAQKAANKHVVPTEDKPKLPTEARHNKTSSTTEMANNRTTTEAAIEGVPVVVTEVDAKSGTSEPPMSGQTAAANPGIKVTGAGEEKVTVTTSQLTTEQSQSTQHSSPIKMTNQPSSATPLSTQQAVSSVHVLLVNGTESKTVTTMTPSAQPTANTIVLATPSKTGSLLNSSVDVEENPETRILGTNNPTGVTMGGGEPTEKLKANELLNATNRNDSEVLDMSDSEVVDAAEKSKEPVDITGTPSMIPALGGGEPTEEIEANKLLNATSMSDSELFNAAEKSEEPVDTTETPSMIPDYTKEPSNGGTNFSNTDSGEQAEEELANLVTDENGTVSSSESEAGTTETPFNIEMSKQTIKEASQDEDELSRILGQAEDDTTPSTSATPEMPSERASTLGLIKAVTKEASENFRTLDTDEDNLLSQEELLKIKILPEDGVSQYINALDKNDDQHLDEDELNRALEQMEDNAFGTDIEP